MRFTEHELTAALTGAAKAVLASQRSVRKNPGGVDAAWEALTRYQRFQMLDNLGDQLLPVLIKLPDIEVAPGTAPTYTHQQVSQVVAELVDQDLGRVRRAVVIKARTILVLSALAAIGPRLDPDALSTEP